MVLAELVVLNRSGAAKSPTALLPHALVLSTCLREVRIAALPVPEQPTLAQASAAGYELHTGVDGYRFLLHLACGLESEIAGETEILGQIKQTWRDFETAGSAQVAALRPWIQRLLQDVKEVRSEHVAGLGSATYGSLVRRLLGGELAGPTLLIGAGQLAETILPFLDRGEVMVWNRTRERAADMLARQRAAQSTGRVHLLDTSSDAEHSAWHRARDVILCVPVDATRDAQRVQCWDERIARDGRVLHLGIHSANGTHWGAAANLYTLRDLFNLRDAQASQRELLLARARRACRDKAQLARLDDAEGARAGNSNHGWEDLAVFQSLGR